MKLKRKAVLIFHAALHMAFPLQAAAEETAAQNLHVKTLLSEYHVSGVTAQALEGKSIDKMIASLQDPYTAFFTDAEYENYGSMIENEYVGMGARVGIDDGGIYIAEVLMGSPAEKAGLLQEDYILSVDGYSAASASLDSVVSRIIGLPGTSVGISVQRGTETLTYHVVRGSVNIPEVNSKSFGGGVGYVQITDFSNDADEEFGNQLEALKAKGLNALILDLRNNPGGYLDTAKHIAKHFIREGTLIHTVDRYGNDHPELIEGGTTQPFQVKVLLNENSASASEVLSGALQDYGAAKVIGMKSYGKGSVQQLFQLKSGGVLKMTIEEYLTPNLHKVNQVGIKPDIEVDGGAAQMIAALRQSGVRHIKVEISKHKVTMNGVEVEDRIPIIYENGQAFVPSRTAASLIGADIKWNDAKKTVEVSSSQTTQSFPAESGMLLLENGTSFVNLDVFAAKFPQLAYQVKGNAVTLEAGKEK